MKAIIVTESSGTVDGEAEKPLLDYYKGQFRPVKTLVEDLSSFATSEVYILSEEYGFCKGSQTPAELESMEGSSDEEAQSCLLQEVGDTDVVVLLLTKSAFSSVINPIWGELIESAKPQSIWGLGLPQSVLNDVDLEPLEEKSNLFVYPRVGVARIDIDTREKIISAAQKRTTHSQR